jgi:hypothetical protein
LTNERTPEIELLSERLIGVAEIEEADREEEEVVVEEEVVETEGEEEVEAWDNEEEGCEAVVVLTEEVEEEEEVSVGELTFGVAKFVFDRTMIFLGARTKPDITKI